MRVPGNALAVLVLALAGPFALAEETWYLVDFKPGPNWVDTQLFDGQQGAEAHREHVATLFARGQALMSGTLGARSRVVVFRGPMRVVREAVADDPMVRSGTVTAAIQPFDIEQSRVRITPALLAPDGKDAQEPFTLGGPNKNAPIRIEEDRATP